MWLFLRLAVKSHSLKIIYQSKKVIYCSKNQSQSFTWLWFDWKNRDWLTSLRLPSMSAVSTQHSLMRDHYLSSKLVIGIPFCNMTVGILPLHFKPIFIRHSLSAIPIPHSPPLLAISGFSAQNFQAPYCLPVSIKPPSRQKCVKYRVYKTRVLK